MDVKHTSVTLKVSHNEHADSCNSEIYSKRFSPPHESCVDFGHSVPCQRMRYVSVPTSPSCKNCRELVDSSVTPRLQTPPQKSASRHKGEQNVQGTLSRTNLCSPQPLTSCKSCRLTSDSTARISAKEMMGTKPGDASCLTFPLGYSDEEQHGGSGDSTTRGNNEDGIKQNPLSKHDHGLICAKYSPRPVVIVKTQFEEDAHSRRHTNKNSKTPLSHIIEETESSLRLENSFHPELSDSRDYFDHEEIHYHSGQGAEELGLLSTVIQENDRDKGSITSHRYCLTSLLSPPKETAYREKNLPHAHLNGSLTGQPPDVLKQNSNIVTPFLLVVDNGGITKKWHKTSESLASKGKTVREGNMEQLFENEGNDYFTDLTDPGAGESRNYSVLSEIARRKEFQVGNGVIKIVPSKFTMGAKEQFYKKIARDEPKDLKCDAEFFIGGEIHASEQVGSNKCFPENAKVQSNEEPHDLDRGWIESIQRSLHSTSQRPLIKEDDDILRKIRSLNRKTRNSMHTMTGSTAQLLNFRSEILDLGNDFVPNLRHQSSLSEINIYDPATVLSKRSKSADQKRAVQKSDNLRKATSARVVYVTAGEQPPIGHRIPNIGDKLSTSRRNIENDSNEIISHKLHPKTYADHKKVTRILRYEKKVNTSQEKRQVKLRSTTKSKTSLKDGPRQRRFNLFDIRPKQIHQPQIMEKNININKNVQTEKFDEEKFIRFYTTKGRIGVAKYVDKMRDEKCGRGRASRRKELFQKQRIENLLDKRIDIYMSFLPASKRLREAKAKADRIKEQRSYFSRVVKGCHTSFIKPDDALWRSLHIEPDHKLHKIIFGSTDTLLVSQVNSDAESETLSQLLSDSVVSIDESFRADQISLSENPTVTAQTANQMDQTLVQKDLTNVKVDSPEQNLPHEDSRQEDPNKGNILSDKVNQNSSIEAIDFTPEKNNESLERTSHLRTISKESQKIKENLEAHRKEEHVLQLNTESTVKESTEPMRATEDQPTTPRGETPNMGKEQMKGGKGIRSTAKIVNPHRLEPKTKRSATDKLFLYKPRECKKKVESDENNVIPNTKTEQAEADSTCKPETMQTVERTGEFSGPENSKNSQTVVEQRPPSDDGNHLEDKHVKTAVEFDEMRQIIEETSEFHHKSAPPSAEPNFDPQTSATALLKGCETPTSLNQPTSTVNSVGPSKGAKKERNCVNPTGDQCPSIGPCISLIPKLATNCQKQTLDRGTVNHRDPRQIVTHLNCIMKNESYTLSYKHDLKSLKKRNGDSYKWCDDDWRTLCKGLFSCSYANQKPPSEYSDKRGYKASNSDIYHKKIGGQSSTPCHLVIRQQTELKTKKGQVKTTAQSKRFKEIEDIQSLAYSRMIQKYLQPEHISLPEKDQSPCGNFHIVSQHNSRKSSPPWKGLAKEQTICHSVGRHQQTPTKMFNPVLCKSQDKLSKTLKQLLTPEKCATYSGFRTDGTYCGHRQRSQSNPRGKASPSDVSSPAGKENSSCYSSLCKKSDQKNTTQRYRSTPCHCIQIKEECAVEKSVEKSICKADQTLQKTGVNTCSRRHKVKNNSSCKTAQSLGNGTCSRELDNKTECVNPTQKMATKMYKDQLAEHFTCRQSPPINRRWLVSGYSVYETHNTPMHVKLWNKFDRGDHVNDRLSFAACRFDFNTLATSAYLRKYDLPSRGLWERPRNFGADRYSLRTPSSRPNKSFSFVLPHSSSCVWTEKNREREEPISEDYHRCKFLEKPQSKKCSRRQRAHSKSPRYQRDTQNKCFPKSCLSSQPPSILLRNDHSQNSTDMSKSHEAPDSCSLKLGEGHEDDSYDILQTNEKSFDLIDKNSCLVDCRSTYPIQENDTSLDGCDTELSHRAVVSETRSSAPCPRDSGHFNEILTDPRKLFQDIVRCNIRGLGLSASRSKIQYAPGPTWRNSRPASCSLRMASSEIFHHKKTWHHPFWRS